MQGDQHAHPEQPAAWQAAYLGSSPPALPPAPPAAGTRPSRPPAAAPAHGSTSVPQSSSEEGMCLMRLPAWPACFGSPGQVVGRDASTASAVTKDSQHVGRMQAATPLHPPKRTSLIIPHPCSRTHELHLWKRGLEAAVPQHAVPRLACIGMVGNSLKTSSSRGIRCQSCMLPTTALAPPDAAAGLGAAAACPSSCCGADEC